MRSIAASHALPAVVTHTLSCRVGLNPTLICRNCARDAVPAIVLDLVCQSHDMLAHGLIVPSLYDSRIVQAPQQILATSFCVPCHRTPDISGSPLRFGPYYSSLRATFCNHDRILARFHAAILVPDRFTVEESAQYRSGCRSRRRSRVPTVALNPLVAEGPHPARAHGRAERHLLDSAARRRAVARVARKRGAERRERRRVVLHFRQSRADVGRR